MAMPEQLIHFDRKAVPEILGDSKEFIAEVLRMVTEELKRACVALEKHIDETNLAGIAAEAHKLYGTTLTAGLPVLAGLVQQFESQPLFDETKARHLLAQIKDEVIIVTAEINTFLTEV